VKKRNTYNNMLVN